MMQTSKPTHLLPLAHVQHLPQPRSAVTQPAVPDLHTQVDTAAQLESTMLMLKALCCSPLSVCCTSKATSSVQTATEDGGCRIHCSCSRLETWAMFAGGVSQVGAIAIGRY